MLLKDLQTLATKLATGTLFHVEKAGKAYSVDYNALAKAIIEEYADSTVGGSKQSVQAAIGALNSRLTSKTIGAGSFNDINTPGYYYVTSGVTEAPKPNCLWRIRVESYSNAASQYANRNGTAELYFRFLTNNVWSKWYKIETSVA